VAEARFRLDKWLWHARVVKTRGLAQALVEKGRVRINRQKTDAPGKGVKLGDVLTLTLPHGVRVLEILAFGERRGPAQEASALYRDLSPRSAPSDDGEVAIDEGAAPEIDTADDD
jgi:ribosome-associated heat shock protein Hsp15